MSNYYTSIPHTIWISPKVKKLNFKEKLVYLYLQTNEQVYITGLYRIYKEQIKRECGLSNNAVKKAIKTLIDNSLVVYWEDENLIYLHGFFKKKVEASQDQTILINIILRQKGYIKNKEAWKIFETEYKEELSLLRNGGANEE